MKLGTAGNTQGPALHIIEVEKEYIVFYETDDSSDYSQWIAIKGDNAFFAENPESLLGLITISESLGDKWNEFSDYDMEHIYERRFSDNHME